MLLLCYSLSTPVIVIAIVELDEESLASVWQVIVSSSGMLLSAIGVLKQGIADADDPASITTSTRPIKGISLFMVASLSDTDSWPQCMGKPPIGAALLAKPAS